jgi:hypothetical protein
VYRSFKDIDAFREEIERLQEGADGELPTKQQIPLLPDDG